MSPEATPTDRPHHKDALRRLLYHPSVPSPLTISGVMLALLLCIPLVAIVLQALSAGDATWSHLYDTVLSDYLINTSILFVGVAIGTLLLGVSTAWLVTMCPFPGSQIFQWLLLLPFAMPAYLMAYTYTDVLEFAGPVQTLLRDTFGWGRADYWFPEIRSIGGAIVIFSLGLYPYVYMLCRASFLEQSVCVLEAGRVLGRTPWGCFNALALPLARPAMIGGLSLALMETLADYGTVDYFAVDTFTTGIYRTLENLDSPAGAAQLSLLLLGLVGILLVMERLSRRHKRFHHTTNRYRYFPQWRLKGWRAVLAFLVCALPVILGFFLPLLILVNFALNPESENLYSKLVGLSLNSFFLAAVTALLAVLCGALLAYGLRVKSGVLSRIACRTAAMGYAVPGTVIGIGIVLSFGWMDTWLIPFLTSVTGDDVGLILSGSVMGLVLAYLVRFMAIALKSMESGLSKISPSMDLAGRTLGLSGSGVLGKVHLPLMRGTALTAALLVFVDVMKELPATLILRPFNFDTLAVRVYHLASDERLSEAALPALIIVAVSLLPVIMLSRIIAHSRPGEKISTDQ